MSGNMNQIAAKGKASGDTGYFPASGYREIVGTIQQWIKMGRFKPGDRLPPEMELSRQFDVTRLTVRRALDVLETRSLICRARRRGTFVSDGALLPPVVSPLSQSLRQVMQRTDRFSVKFLGGSLVRPDVAAKAALRIGHEEMVHEFRFLRSIKSEPLGYFVYRVPEWVATQLDPIEDSENFHLRRSLISLGFESKRILQKVGAEVADATVAKVLLLKDTGAVLRFRLTHYDARERPFLYASTYFRSDNYEYSIEFVEDSKIRNLRDP